MNAEANSASLAERLVPFVAVVTARQPFVELTSAPSTGRGARAGVVDPILREDTTAVRLRVLEPRR